MLKAVTITLQFRQRAGAVSLSRQLKGQKTGAESRTGDRGIWPVGGKKAADLFSQFSPSRSAGRRLHGFAPGRGAVDRAEAWI